MSWSFNAIGRPAAIAKAAKAYKFSQICAEPEETYKNTCLDFIATSAEQQIGNIVLHVSASGSMWKDGDVVKSHSISLDFKPFYGFVE